MSEYERLIEKIYLLEYHQQLLLQLLDNPKLQFNKLIIEKGLTKLDVEQFYQICDELSIELEKQKAEGFVYYHPLFNKLAESLPANLNMKDVVRACLAHKLYEPLFQEFQKYIHV